MKHQRKNKPDGHHKPHKSRLWARSTRLIDGTGVTVHLSSCCNTRGQHGAARYKRAGKHALTQARRRADRRFIQKELGLCQV